MSSISTSRGAQSTARSRMVGFEDLGFTMIELMLGLTLAVMLALAVSPLWVSLQRTSVSAGDQTLRLLQERVAVSRFERDMRLASAADCPFELSAPIVEATKSRVVIVAPAAVDQTPIVVEWEIVGGTLMRRWGDCPSNRTLALAGSVYRDNKTMLEGVQKGSAFSYLVDGTVLPVPAREAELAAIQTVVLDLRAKGDGARSPVRVAAEARVGR